jgi:hypothetical protein
MCSKSDSSNRVGSSEGRRVTKEGDRYRAGELAGATLPDTLSAGDKTLKLNGLGL